MISYTFKHIAEIINGRILQLEDPGIIEQLALDSRTIIFPSTSIFFALAGERRDGHEFINEVYQQGIRNFVVSSAIDIRKYKDANFVQVNDTLTALQELAAHHRSRFSIPVIGITGSNGKTIVKEWLNHLLEDNFKIARSPKSYNSQIGVPLSVWQLNEDHELGIFEAGISRRGEMKRLERIIQPTIGILTNLGEAHSEGFNDLHEKLSEKISLFEQVEIIFYHADDKLVNDVLQKYERSSGKKLVSGARLFSWGEGRGNTLMVVDLSKGPGKTDIKCIYEEQAFQLQLPFTDDASIQNLISCIAVLLFFKFPIDVIQNRIARLQPISMRLELKKGINHCSMINDSYSADLSSLKIALDFLAEQRQHPKKTVIISDFLQSGLDAAVLYDQIAAALTQKGVNRIIGVGKQISGQESKFKKIPERRFFNSTEELIRDFSSIEFNNETILLKGARVFGFEQVDRLLEQKLHETVLQINLNAIVHNLNQYQQLVSPGTKLMAMVKAFAYGSGSYEIVSMLQFHKVDYLAVAYVDEGVDLRKAGIHLPIMVMNTESTSFGTCLEYNLEPVVYSIGLIEELQFFMDERKIESFPIHLEINTGMNRLGIDPDELEEAIERLRPGKLKLVSVFSHLAASEEPQHDGFTRQQARIFRECCQQLENSIGHGFLKHIANTAAAIRHPDLQMDMVRLGIGLYGIDSAASGKLRLEEVSVLRSTISQLRKVKAGETVSYGKKGVVSKDSLIATVRIGYADGYPRSLSNGKGRMMVNGKLAPIIGAICMDMTMIDVTEVESAREGDEVIVFGPDLSVTQLAIWADTIPYEILTGVSQRVKRVYYRE